MTTAPRWILKLGGSLSADPLLRDWLALLVAHAAAGIVIVPGGGGFADAVREAQPVLGYDDAAAHDMAILAMAQTACLLRSLEPRLRLVDDRRELSAVAAAGTVAVWRPLDVVHEVPLRPGWDLTSDSLALWLATQIGAAGVVLVKSCALPASRDPADWAAAGIVDARLPSLAEGTTIDLRLMHRADLAGAARLLASTAASNPTG